MAPTEHQRFCQTHIAAAEEADLPLSVYAKEHGISVHQLYSEKRRQRLQRHKQLPAFVRVDDAPVLSPSLLQIRLPNGVSLALPTHQIPLDQMLHTLAKL